ncbi:MAG: DUF1501 domain-containing protein [Gemmataceae bacterium]|nr:DUF1501 domain-containing protein [Gemmataceae bacterium]
MLTIQDRLYRAGDRMSRRSFLKAGALGAAGLSLADLLRLRACAGTASRARHKSVIMVLLGGGPSHIDMYDLKPNAPAEFRGEFKPIQTNVPGFDICELMPEQARIADQLALVRNLQMRTSSHNHEEECVSGFLYDRKVPGAQGDPRPAFGSVVSKLRHTDALVPSYVTLSGQHPSEEPYYVGAAHRPFAPSGPDLANLSLPRGLTVERSVDRQALLRALDTIPRSLDAHGQVVGMDTYQARAFEMLSSSRARDAFDILREPDRIRAKYGLTAGVRSYEGQYVIGQQFLTARRLVEAGVSVVTLSVAALGHWDTHDDNFPRLREMLPALDRGVAALVGDLRDRGLDKDVAVVVWGEFGRAPRISTLPGSKKGAGRDHWGNANFALFAGGGFRRGQVIGATDARAERPRGAAVRPQNVLSTLYHHLGIDPATSLLDNAGRPMYLLDDREPIAELL